MFRFRVLGIPVVIDTWFLLGMFFIYSWSGGGRAGMFAAGAIAVFTLIHELGHAVTARHYGCAVDIRLNMLMGWASFTSVRPLTRVERVIISLAGPVVELVAGLGTLAVVHVLMHGQAVGPVATLGDDLWRGVAWAGVVIALLNLLPLWPLDGGHVVQKLIESKAGERRSLRVMAIVSLVGCGLLVVAAIVGQQGSSTVFDGVHEHVRQYVVSGLRQPLPAALLGVVTSLPGLLDGLLLLPLFCGMASVQLLNHLRTQDMSTRWIDTTEASPQRRDDTARPDSGALAAEREGWLSGRVGAFPRGWAPSPWLLAWVNLRAGDQPGVRAALADVVGGGRWIAPEARQAELRGLVPYLPDPLPLGARARNLDLLSVLGQHADAHAVVRYASALYGHDPDAEVLYRAAAGLASLGEQDAAMAWLTRAVQDEPDPERLARDAGLAPLHTRLDFQQLLTRVRSGAPAVG